MRNRRQRKEGWKKVPQEARRLRPRHDRAKKRTEREGQYSRDGEKHDRPEDRVGHYLVDRSWVIRDGRAEIESRHVADVRRVLDQKWLVEAEFRFVLLGHLVHALLDVATDCRLLH